MSDKLTLVSEDRLQQLMNERRAFRDVAFEAQKMAKERMDQVDALKAKLAAAKHVINAAKGFRDHGEAKNGTHATILFEALAALEAKL